MIEPYKIKVIEPIRLIAKEERETLLKNAHYNTFLLPAESVYIDLVSDSGTSALSVKAWSEIIEADEAFAFQKSYFKLIEVAREIFGFPNVLLVHQGRMGEHVLFKFLVKPGNYVLSNTLFETTQTNIEYYGGRAVNLPGELGDIDLTRLNEFIKEVGSKKISFVLLTLTNNQQGGWPVRLENIKECKSLLSKYGIPLWIDGARWAENMYFIKGKGDTPSSLKTPLPREVFSESMCKENTTLPLTIKEATKLVFSYADGFFLSAKKSGLSSIGGLIGTRDELLLQNLEEFAIAVDGFTSHGGISGRDIAAMTQGLLESMDEELVEFRMHQLMWFGSLFKDVPILKPIGGNGVYIKVNEFLPHLKSDEFPAMSLSCEVWLEGGVRGAPWGEFYRFAVPRRVYTNNHLQYVAEVVTKVFNRREELKGLKAMYFPERLGIFRAKFQPII